MKTTESGGPRGFDAGKKVMGRKRHIVVDTGGRLLGAVAHAADIQDRDGAPALLAELGAWFPEVGHIFADGAYAGPKLAGALNGIGDWALEIVSCLVDSLPNQAKGSLARFPFTIRDMNLNPAVEGGLDSQRPL